MAQPAVAQDELHESTNWDGGVAQTQQTMSWCFAAASATVQACFGTNMTQVRIAHDSLMAIGANGDGAGVPENAVRYVEGVQNLWLTHDLADTAWATVRTRVEADNTLMGYLRGTYGAPQLAGRTYTGGGRLSEQQMIDTLNNNGLIIAGNAYHYMVINAWRRVNGVVNFRRYNPMGGGNNWVSSNAAREVGNQPETPADQVTTFRVTA